jgi:hypothetical protein
MNSFQASGPPPPPLLANRLEGVDAAAADADNEDDNVDDELNWEGRGAGPAADIVT